MSTPPRVDLPDGLAVERWQIGAGARAVLRSELRGAREWAVLVPGFTGSKEDFISVLPLLSAAGIGAVSFDQLGQFESDVSGDPEDYSVDALGADVGRIIQHASDRFGLVDPPHLVGHSFGGLVAQAALINGAARPASFVALCTGPGGLPRSRWAGLPDLVDSLADVGLPEIWMRMRDLDRLAGTPQPEPEIAAFLERRWLANSPLQLRQAAIQLMGLPSMTDRLRTVISAALPMTVMWGELDYAWPRRVQAQMAADLGSPAVEIPGVGHSPNADDPAALVEHLIGAWRS